VNTEHQDEFITIGKVLKTRGLRGEVKVLPLTDIPGRFEQLDTVYARITPQNILRVAIENVRYYKGFVYLYFQGKHSPEDVRMLIGSDLQVKRAESPALPEGVYYHFEILGSEVYTDEHQRLGTVSDILETGAHDVYIVQGNDREYLIPATQEIVIKIDREKGMIIIHPLEGLLDV
jgi:16S rRNA processing protein RimM